MDTAAIDAAMEELTASKARWVGLPVARKREYLESIRRNTAAMARPWVEAAVEAKGLGMDDPLAGEEWTSGPYAVMSLVNALAETLRRLEEGVPVLEGYDRWETPHGQAVVDVFPMTTDERLLFSGVRAQVWMDPDIEIEDLDEHVASIYRNGELSGDLCVVLAAGNIASIAPLDVIHALFNEGEVAMLKMNPVNDYLGEFLEAVFADLVEDGYLRFAYGGVDVGRYLTTHPLADSIHITGSVRTHDAIVYGDGEAGVANKAADTPVNDRPVASELGGVTPVIVVPGDWSERDLRFQAEHIVSQKMHNSGFNCIAAQVLVLPRDWEHTPALLDEVRAAMAAMGDRHPYYPGTDERVSAAIDRPGTVEVYGGSEPRYLVPDLDPDDTDEVLFTTEVFGPVLGVTMLPSPDVPSYLIKAVRFANERLYGTLGATVLVHPRTERRHHAAMMAALRDLRYGTVAINSWSGVAFFMPKCTWGAFPGHTRQDIGSGTDIVHNVLKFDEPQKSVVRGPFAPAERSWLTGEVHVAPKPVYFVTNAKAHEIGERLIPYTESGSRADLMKVAAAAIRG